MEQKEDLPICKVEYSPEWNSYCENKKKKQKIYRKRAKRNNMDFINKFKESKGCKFCGIKDFRVLDFHHKFDNKEFTISTIRNAGLKRIKLEMEKCIVVCANCHRLIHSGGLEDEE